MQDMQDMIDRLNQSGKRLSKGHRKIAQYIVEHYDKAVFMTASRLGESVGVSESTVVRFAAAMGYEGYPVGGADDGAEERHAKPAQHLGTG